MRNRFTVIFAVVSCGLYSQSLSLPDLVIFPFGNTYMNSCNIYSISGENSKRLLVSVSGSDGDNYKNQSLPHTNSYKYAAFFDGNALKMPLLQLEDDSYRSFPYIEKASIPTSVNQELVVQHIASSAKLQFYFKNLRTGTDQYLPQGTGLQGWTALSDKPVVKDGRIFALIVRCDGFGLNGAYDYNGIDDDTLHLVEVDWTTNNIQFIAKYLVPNMANNAFQYLQGQFDYNPETGLLKFISGPKYYEYSDNNLNASRLVTLPPLYSGYGLNAIEDTNYFRLDNLFNPSDSSYPGWSIYKWYIKDDSFIADTFDFIRQEELQTHSNSRGLWYFFYKMDKDFIYYGKEKAPNFDPSQESKVELIKARHNGEIVWRRTFFNAEIPGRLDRIRELNDTLICTGHVYHYARRSGMEKRKKYPFIRIVTKDGKFVNQPKPEASPIYPNPYQVDFYINLPDLRTLYLYDFNGNLLSEKQFENEHYINRIQWPELENGLYLLMAIDAKGNSFSYRLMKSN